MLGNRHGQETQRMSKKQELLDELNIAITLRHATIAHQLVDELIGLGDIEYVADAFDEVTEKLKK